MKTSNQSVSEKIRLEELKSFSILDTMPDSDYDNLTAIASQICGTPISLVSLLDKHRQWFKSHHGLDATETPIAHSFCAHAVQTPGQIFEIQDARKDARFSTNPLVTGDPKIVFYAGIPLISEGGFPLGTLCVIDHVPRILTESQKYSLQALSNQVMKLLELRKSKHELEKAYRELEERNQFLERFTQVAATDIKSPLRNIINNSGTFSEKYEERLDEEARFLIHHIRNSAFKLSSLVEGLLETAKADRLMRLKKTMVSLDEVQEELQKLYPPSEKYRLEFFFRVDQVYVNKTILEQIFSNLISNAIRYNDKKVAKVELGAREIDGNYEFFVSDNGIGIDEVNHHRIFDMFTVIEPVDRFGDYGTGIGLSNVKKLLDEIGGDIEVESEKGNGTIFTFFLRK